jgi:dolichol-phosphate mannosyltransferase
MPEYNEGRIILDFISSLKEQFLDCTILIVDDCSTYDNQKILRDNFCDSEDVQIIFNNVNYGHGYSTLLGLRKSLESESEIIIAVDGDGQFSSTDIKKCFKELIENDSIEIVEGNRVSRNDVWFRKIISTFTRLLVFTSCHIIPRDANTPLRVYRRETLQKLLENVPLDSLIPNLHISKLARILGIKLREVEVVSLPRGGKLNDTQSNGVTWKQKYKYIPSKRLLIFVYRATLEWLKIK